jgi:hypothetical protein
MNSNPNRGNNRKEEKMNIITKTTPVAVLVALGLALSIWAAEPLTPELRKGSAEEPVRISGVYPHLGVNGSDECGIGVLAPFAGKLWFNWYGSGGGGELYSVDEQLKLTAHLRGVPGLGDRMIHPESDQLFIAGCVVNKQGVARKLTGTQFRCTAAARHLTDPANKIYIYGMEGHLAEVDVHTGQGTVLFRVQEKGVTGAHGKGGYTGQGRLVVANNGGRGGGLAEWDGQKWTLLEEKQFTDVTSPGGIRGAARADDPLWTVGWDARSVILKVCDQGKWHDYRLPKASYTHDAGHGWYTEWPRIRETTPGKYMLDHHGMFYDFPANFRPGRTAGLRPLATHLRMVSDWCLWKDKLVMAHDDASKLASEGLCQQSQSNLWFGDPAEVATAFGKPAGWGGPWIQDKVIAGQPSDPMLLAGFEKRMVHLANHSAAEVTFTLELDIAGDGQWTNFRDFKVPATGYVPYIFPADCRGEWVRLRTDKDCTATAYFHFSNSGWPGTPALFRSLASGAEPRCEGLVIDRRSSDRLDFFTPAGHYEMNPRMEMTPGAATRPAVLTPTPVKRGELLFPEADAPVAGGREVRAAITERSLANLNGTFYEVPHVGGLRRTRPVATHAKAISDYACWRGLLVLAGTRSDAKPDGHCFPSADGKTSLWFGKIDDLWQMGKPRGAGGPWRKSAVTAGRPSAPFLMTGYDRKTLELSHDAKSEVTFTVEVDFLAAGNYWGTYATLKVPAGQTLRHEFPDGYSAHWVRLRTDANCNATAWFTYE